MGYGATFVFLCLSIILTKGTGTSLKQIHVLFRHGERSPTETYPNDAHKNYIWSGGWGHLTNKGKYQMYRFGQIFRENYKYFLPRYYWHEDINFTSSYADRCLMSAELVAAGILPPKDEQIWNNDLLWQPIPIHYVPRIQDNFIAMKKPCQKYDLMFKNVNNSPKVQQINKENEELLSYLSNNTDMVVNSIATVEKLFNTLEIEKLNNLTLPIWVNTTLMKTMKELGAQNLALYTETEFMKRMKGGVLLKKIITSMKRKIDEKKEPSLTLYSGHDLTIVNVLRSLNLVNTIKPGFGASVTFELYSDQQIKVLYSNSWDDQGEIKLFEACKSPCLLQEFEDLLKPVLPENWDEECKLDIPQTS